MADKTEAIRNALNPEHVLMLETVSKAEALSALVEALSTSPHIRDVSELKRTIFAREELMSTGIGMGLGVPHVRIASVTEIAMAVGISREGIADYASLDDEPVHLIFLIAAPEGQHLEYIRLLSAISSRAKALRGRLLNCEDADAFCRVFMADQGDTQAGAGA